MIYRRISMISSLQSSLRIQLPENPVSERSWSLSGRFYWFFGWEGERDPRRASETSTICRMAQESIRVSCPERARHRLRDDADEVGPRESGQLALAGAIPSFSRRTCPTRQRGGSSLLCCITFLHSCAPTAPPAPTPAPPPGEERELQIFSYSSLPPAEEDASRGVTCAASCKPPQSAGWRNFVKNGRHVIETQFLTEKTQILTEHEPNFRFECRYRVGWNFCRGYGLIRGIMLDTGGSKSKSKIVRNLENIIYKFVVVADIPANTGSCCYYYVWWNWTMLLRHKHVLGTLWTLCSRDCRTWIY